MPTGVATKSHQESREVKKTNTKIFTGICLLCHRRILGGRPELKKQAGRTRKVPSPFGSVSPKDRLPAAPDAAPDNCNVRQTKQNQPAKAANQQRERTKRELMTNGTSADLDGTMGGRLGFMGSAGAATNPNLPPGAAAAEEEEEMGWKSLRL